MPLEAQNLMNERRREAFKSWKRDELIVELIASNQIGEAVVTPEEQFAHPQLQANDMAARVEDRDLGSTTQMGVPIHLLGTPGGIVSPQPAVGQHDAEVFGGLGYSDDEVARITGSRA